MMRACLKTAAVAVAALMLGAGSAAAAGMDVTPSTARTAYVNQAYRASFYASSSSVSGAVPPYSIEWVDGTLPQGLNYYVAPNSDELLIYGTPTLPQSTQFTLGARDSSGQTGTRTYTLDVQVANTEGVTNTLNGAVAAAVYLATTYARTVPCQVNQLPSYLTGHGTRPCN